jgi:hypothetical protein
MATPASTPVPTEDAAPSASEPLVEPGDRLTGAEFERRYQRMPNLKKAQLIEGTVYLPSPVRARRHGKPHIRLAALRRGLDSPEHVAFLRD